MSLKNRLSKAQKSLPSAPKKGLDPKVKWLLENCREYRECFKSFYRLKIKEGKPTSHLDEWDDDLREPAKALLQKMNNMYQEVSDSLVYNNNKKGSGS